MRFAFRGTSPNVTAAASCEQGPAARQPLVHSQRGAVYVEFLIAFLPTFILYLGVTEIALLYTSKLLVTRAATVAARAAVVVLPDDVRYYEDGTEQNKISGDRLKLIEDAAGIALLTTYRPWGFKVEVNEGADSVDAHQDITVKVTYQHRCIMPIVRSIACDPPGQIGSFAPIAGSKTTEVSDSATLVNQGASYDYNQSPADKGDNGPLNLPGF